MELVTNTRIVVVDDDKFQLKVIEEILARTYETFCFDTPVDALEFIDTNPVDILITDIFMPVINGLELMEEAMKIKPDLISIVITGSKDVDYAVESIRKGGSDFLQKPLDMNKLLNAIKNGEDLIEKRQRKIDFSVRHKPAYNFNYQQLGPYLLVDRIGSGANGTVYRARKTDGQDTDFAIKIMNPVINKDERDTLFNRFIHEGEALTLISHPSVIKCFECNIFEKKGQLTPYIVMEYFKGKPLSYHLDNIEQLNMGDKIDIICKIAEGLGAVHQKGIFHRDIKPDNILINEKLNIKITDFGVCHLPMSNLTAKDMALGSAYYFAPEQLSSDNLSQVVDIFSLGVICYELFLGIKPFNGKLFHVLVNKIVNDYPVEPRLLNPDFPIDLQHILAKMLKKNPKHRYQNTADIITDLRQFQNHTSKQSIYDKIKNIVMFRQDWQKRK